MHHQDEAEKYRNAVLEHFKQRGDNRCHLDDLKLYREVLGIEPDPYVTALPPECDMLESCKRYIRQRQAPEVVGTYPVPEDMTIAQLTEALVAARTEMEQLRNDVRKAEMLILLSPHTAQSGIFAILDSISTKETP